MTTLEMILIIYILLNWFLCIMVAVLPTRFIRITYFILVIICPPLGIGVIGELLRKIHDKREEQKEKRK